MDLFDVLRAGLSSAFGPYAIMLALAAIGLNVHFGYTGLLNFGQAGFMAVAGYGMAVSVTVMGLPFGVGLVVALIAPIVLALLLGAPTLRLRADYLAIATIAAAEILRLIFGSVQLADTLGGTDGLTGYAGTFQSWNPYDSGLDLGIISFRRAELWSITVGWIAIGLSVLLVWLLMRSPWGRVLKAIREDEEAVRSLGKNVFAYKMQALVLGGFFGGLAGLFLALHQASVVPTDYETVVTFFAYTALLIGGAARVWGPVIGAVIFWFLVRSLGTLFGQMTSGADPLMPEWLMTDIQSGLVRYILAGLGLMLLMIFRPQGIFGDRKELAIDGR
ncbi:branched-chain amino acid ABC transporter permease [Nocardioides panacisoli]|uniref:branched-chain amino acid ABC transporter permease n=1 Tax=Nocardioides panacisoli TaxID=627624 RepID=UPI001C62CE0A|nr:branched-chain amino acid ABC transporter permease [Nocardioides panacisoli]QYJ04777.1 branched-chain amino acid ABC transporter permease [Nocardioides panacisoli]